jgi:fermentation-respiration switch protein FrsA (DUF1100 family)
MKELMSMMKQTLLIAGAALILVLFIYLFQRSFLYFPNTKKPSRSEFQAGDMDVIELTTQDGLVLNAWYKPAAKNKPTLLYVHGNAGHIGHRMPLVRPFLNAGLGVLLLEYRGYGGNKGSPHEAGLYEDGRSALRFLSQKGINPNQLVIFGESLGSGVATQLATEQKTCALVLQTPYTSMTDLARVHYPLIPLKPKDRFDSLSRIQTINTPLLILHGTADSIVPYEQALRLYNAAKEPKKLLSFAGKEHNDLWVGTYAQEIIGFIEHHCS